MSNFKRLTMLSRRLAALEVATQQDPELYCADVFGVFGPEEQARLALKGEGLQIKQGVGVIADDQLGQLTRRFKGDALGFASMDPEMRAEGLTAIATYGMLTPGYLKHFGSSPESADQVYTEGLRAAQEFFGMTPKEACRVFCGPLEDDMPTLTQVMHEVDLLLAQHQVPLAVAA